MTASRAQEPQGAGQGASPDLSAEAYRRDVETGARLAVEDAELTMKYNAGKISAPRYDAAEARVRKLSTALSEKWSHGGRQLKGVTAPQLREFMADVDRAQLPTPANAAALQRAADRGQGAPAPASPIEEVPKPSPTPEPETPVLDAALAKALDERHAAEVQKWRSRHEKEMAELDFQLNLDVRDKLANIDAMHSAARERLTRQHQAEGADFWGRLQALINPDVAARRAADRAVAAEALRDRQLKERTGILTPALAANAAEMEALKDRQARKIHEVEAALEAERERYANDQVQARRILAELQEQQRKIQQEHDRGIGMERGQGPPGPAK